MDRLRIALFSTLMMVVLISSAAAATRTAIVVGNNEGLAHEVTLQYAESDAKKISKVLVDLGSFDSRNVHLLLGKRTDELKKSLGDLLADTATERGDQVFFYYSGHGDGKNLHMAGRRIAIDEIRGALGRSKDGLRVVIIDSCQSGEVTRSKGAKRSPAFDLNVIQGQNVDGSIIITSSSPDEVSQESDDLQGSFFTHYWVAGLYGQADENQDRLVTLEEAYRFAHFQTVDRTIASKGGVQHPSYRFALAGEGNIVMANLHWSTATIQISTGPDGRYFIVDPRNRLVLTELRQKSGSARIELPPGKYRIRKREKNRYLVYDLSLSAGQMVSVADADMRVVAYSNQTKKGGGGTLFGTHRHGPYALYGWRSPIVDGMTVGQDFSLGYQLEWGQLFLRPRLRILLAEIDEGRQRLRHNEYNVGGALGLTLSASPFEVAVGVDGGLVLFDQDAEVIKLQGVNGVVPLGLEGSVFAELSYPVAKGLSVIGFGRAGLLIFRQDENIETSPVFEGGFGLRFLVE